jgi:hypothetical protein
MAGPITIQSGVRQDCPLSMALYALCLKHFLCSLQVCLPGIQVGRCMHVAPVIVYADDVSLYHTACSLSDHSLPDSKIRISNRGTSQSN